MTARTSALPETYAPHVRIRPLLDSMVQDERLYGEKLISFEYRDSAHAREPDECTMEFADPEGELFRPETLALGAAFNVSWGYPDNIAASDVVIKKVKNFWGGSQRGTITLIGRPQAVDRLHRVAALRQTRIPTRFVNARTSQAVTEVAATLGFSGNQAVIEQTEPIHPSIQVMAGETALQFIARMADLHDFSFYVKGRNLHFHSPEFRDLPAPPIDVLSLEVDGDLRLPTPSILEARGYDPKEGRIRILRAEPDGSQTIVGQLERGPYPAGYRPNSEAEESLRAEDVITTSSATTKGAVRAARALRAAADRQWKLRVSIVGNPQVTAGQWLNIVGFGPWVDGPWYTRAAVHKISGGGYTVEIAEATRRSPASASAQRVRRQYITREIAPGEIEIVGSVLTLEP